MRARITLFIFLLSLLLVSLSGQALAFVCNTEMPIVNFSSSSVYPGDYLVVYIENLTAEDEVVFSETFGAANIDFYPCAKGQIALIGLHYDMPVKNYPLNVTIKRNNKKLFSYSQDIDLLIKPFSVQHLKVSSALSAMRDEKLLELDRQYTNQAKASSSAVPLWEGLFIQPLTGRISTEYGLIRYINGVYSGRHSGIDIAASRGTEILAGNSGIIIMAREQYVTGNTIIIDHGLGLFSAYAHLESMLVKPHEKVKKGQVIGYVGSTGFSTGPHLHWTLSIRNIFVNPWLFLDQDPFYPLNSIISSSIK